LIKAKPYTDLLGKTNRIVEAATITGDITSKLILTGWKFNWKFSFRG
jgi:hypothetical protein